LREGVVFVIHAAAELGAVDFCGYASGEEVGVEEVFKDGER
jgi:hypothetical protein